LKEVEIFTDGACRGNPGPGGYGVVLKSGTHRRELSGGFARTTNNRMELLAAIAGLEELKQPCRVMVSSDSRYLVNAMTRGWLQKWKGLGWRRGPGQRLRNEDLWKRLDVVCGQHELHWQWVKGHAGHVENERCDFLAVAAAEGDDLPSDEGYLEQEQLAGEEPGLFG
jgi:ribonuclease HI